MRMISTSRWKRRLFVKTHVSEYEHDGRAWQPLTRVSQRINPYILRSWVCGQFNLKWRVKISIEVLIWPIYGLWNVRKFLACTNNSVNSCAKNYGMELPLLTMEFQRGILFNTWSFLLNKQKTLSAHLTFFRLLRRKIINFVHDYGWVILVWLLTWREAVELPSFSVAGQQSNTRNPKIILEWHSVLPLILEWHSVLPWKHNQIKISYPQSPHVVIFPCGSDRFQHAGKFRGTNIHEPLQL